MLNRLMLWVAKWAVGGKIVGALAWVHNLLDGRKSELLLAVLALVYALKILGIIPAEAADSIEKALLPLLPVVLADRASKIKGMIDKVVPGA